MLQPRSTVPDALQACFNAAVEAGRKEKSEKQRDKEAAEACSCVFVTLL